MARKLKLERDVMEKDIVTRQVGELREKTEKTEELGEKFMRDKSRIEELIAYVETSELPPSIKKERLLSLRKTLEIIKDEFDDQVDKELEEINEASEELLEMTEEKIKESQEHEEKMEAVRMEASDTTLDESINQSKEYREFLEGIKTDEAEELRLRQEQQEIQRRYMERKRGR